MEKELKYYLWCIGSYAAMGDMETSVFYMELAQSWYRQYSNNYTTFYI